MYPACVPSSPSSVIATPSSSPVFGPADSSPPLSPSLDPYLLDSPPRPSAPFSHPFAASTKAIKLPRYEKKADSLSCTPPGTFTLRSIGLFRSPAASCSLQEDDFASSASPNASPPSHRTSRYIDEECIWEDAIRKPFDTGNGQIDLSNQGLTYIPPSIADLAGFFNTPEVSEQRLFSARVWARVNTEPSRTRSFERTQSIKDSGKERHVLKLYLMGNSITSLPRELFTVKNLTVLSLRKNGLTFIPPEICLLTNLHELNISNNRLTFLPWQMHDMKIEKLLVNPNPFLPEPDPTSKHELGMDLDASPPTLRRRRSITRLWPSAPTKPVLSPLTCTLGAVPPLTELCLRLLLTPSPSATTPAHTVLVDYYGLPLPDTWSTRVPPSVHRVLCDAIPGILRPRKRFSVPAPTTSAPFPGTCPNPAHKGDVFVKHGSERYSWERRVAGVDIGGAVPLRWRGCLAGCLDFLEERLSPTPTSFTFRSRSPHVFARGESDGDVEIPELAVQVVDLGHGDLDMDDFDD